MKKIIILVGIPCSGKSTYCKTIPRHVGNYGVSLSRDSVRERSHLFNQPYRFSKQNEQKVTEEFNKKIDFWLSENTDFNVIVLDNTHVKEKYIDSIITEHLDCIIEVKFFDISLLKAHYRNIVRYFKTGKQIPISVMNNMYKSYNKINKQKYAKYMVH